MMDKFFDYLGIVIIISAVVLCVYYMILGDYAHATFEAVLFFGLLNASENNTRDNKKIY